MALRIIDWMGMGWWFNLQTNKFILFCLLSHALTNTYPQMIGPCGISRRRHEPIA